MVWWLLFHLVASVLKIVRRMPAPGFPFMDEESHEHDRTCG